MSEKNKTITFLYSAVIFVLFFSYYFITSNSLPRGAGPDWRSNVAVTQFIYDHGRLAVLPDDEKSLHFTAYGSTRALRPPLSYIVSAITAKALSFTDLHSYQLLRKGSALLCALAVALTFYALSLYFGRYRAGILGAFIIGLMPQFTFIASYNNDDSGAIFSTTLILAVLVRIYRYGADSRNAALLGIASGLIIISKMTAWLVMPFVLLFLILYIREPLTKLLRYTAIASLLFIFSGGWWLAMNVYNYGINDPILIKISTSMSEKHNHLPLGAGTGFASQGIGYRDLLLKNHKGFLTETAKSTIGNLDWLKLRMGPLQYTFYLAIFYIAILYYVFNLAVLVSRRLAGSRIPGPELKQLGFESLLLIAFLFQFFMYTWTNIHNDIQLQGKYIIPVFLTILILFFSGVYRFSALYSHVRKRTSSTEGIATTIPENISTERPDSSKPGTFLVMLATVIFIHWDAWHNFVIPFYNPPAYNIRLGHFKPVDLRPQLFETVFNVDIRRQENGLKLVATGLDPKVIFNSDFCDRLTTSSIFRLDIYAESAGTLQFFIDETGSFSAKTSFSSGYEAGDNTLYLPVSAKHCRRLRFDPFIESGSLLLKSFGIAPMAIQKRPE